MTRIFQVSALVVVLAIWVGCSGSGDQQANRTSEGASSRSQSAPSVSSNRPSQAQSAESARQLRDNRSGETINARSGNAGTGNTRTFNRPATQPSAPPSTSERGTSRGGSSDRDRDVSPPEMTQPGPPGNTPSERPITLPPFPGVTGEIGTEVGDLIPEITGKDVEGVKFQLSDYKGKVVMLDFWGDW